MLWGGGAPFTKNKDGSLRDKIGQRVVMLGAVPEVLLDLKINSDWQDTVVGVASCTDEPSWADECLRLFDVGGGHSIKDCIEIEEIYKANKRRHLQSISEKTGIALEDMLFFDNEWGNIADVSSIGVSCAYVPDGVTQDAWERALSQFPSVGEPIQC